MESFIKELLICPKCHSSDLSFTETYISCTNCSSVFDIINGIPDLMIKEDTKTVDKDKNFDEKFRVNKYNIIYNLGRQIKKKIPTANLIYRLGNTAEINGYFNNSEIVLNIGGRYKHEREKIITLDIVLNKNTNVIGDLERIPLKDNSIDFVRVVAVLHHVKHPYVAVKEIYRVLKKGGYVYAEDCFYYPYHSDFMDCARWTRQGYKYLFDGFKESHIKLIYGPTTSILKALQIYLAMLCSFNSVVLYEFLFLLFGYLLYPFKFLDIVMSKNKMADLIGGGYDFLGMKE